MLSAVLSVSAYTVPHGRTGLHSTSSRCGAASMQYKVQAETKVFWPTKPKNVHTFMTISTPFTVQDWSEQKPIMEDFVNRTRKESGCMYYGWSKTGDKPGDKLFCREAYRIRGVLAHVANVGPCIDALLGEGVATLDEIQLHGPGSELDKCKETFDGFGTAYFEVDSGFSCITKETGGIPCGQRLVTIQPTFTVQRYARIRARAPTLALEPGSSLTPCFTPSRLVSRATPPSVGRESQADHGRVRRGRRLREGRHLLCAWTKSGDKLFCREAYYSGEASRSAEPSGRVSMRCSPRAWRRWTRLSCTARWAVQILQPEDERFRHRILQRGQRLPEVCGSSGLVAWACESSSSFVLIPMLVVRSPD